MVRTHTVLTNELTDALGAGFKPALAQQAWIVGLVEIVSGGGNSLVNDVGTD